MTFSGGQHSSEVASALPTQPSLRQFSAFPNFFNQKIWFCWDLSTAAQLRVDCAKSLIVDRTHLVLVIGTTKKQDFCSGITIKMNPSSCNLCLGWIGWLIICFRCEKWSNELNEKRSNKVVVTFKKGRHLTRSIFVLTKPGHFIFSCLAIRISPFMDGIIKDNPIFIPL